jgi:betaine-aldehyde dehydrogenase
MSRVLAPRTRYDEAVSALVAQASSLVVGDPLAEETTMGPLANPRQRASVESCVTAGIAAGAHVVVGGRRPATPVCGYYYEPTVFAGATAGMAIARDEICGPVVSVIPYDDESEAVAIANDSSYGLAGSVWTNDPERGLRIARRARVGTFGVNLYVPDIGAPWGGRKASGMGHIYGPEGLEAYLSTKCVFLPAAGRG